jgi:prefoldin subunit 5
MIYLVAMRLNYYVFRQAKRKMENLQKEKNSVTESIDELNLYTESAVSSPL